MDLKECYAAASADYEDVMRRFSKEERVDRFLSMFLKDQSFRLLNAAMKEENWEEAFRAVHTMKGICMNLGLTVLLDACAELTENLRAGGADSRTAPCYERLKEEYLRTAGAIRAHLEGQAFAPGGE